MKRFTVLLTLLIGMAISAQAQPRPTFYAHTGISVPTFSSSFKDFYQSGLLFGGGVGLTLSQRTEVTLSGQFSRNKLDQNRLLDEFATFDVTDIAVDGGRYTWFGLAADFKYNIYRRSRGGPYGLIGVGLFNSSADDLVIIEPEGPTTRLGTDEVVFGLNGGIGFYIPVSPALRLVVEPRYTLLLTNDQLLFTTDQTRHFLQVRAGVALRPF